MTPIGEAWTLWLSQSRERLFLDINLVGLRWYGLSYLVMYDSSLF